MHPILSLCATCNYQHSGVAQWLEHLVRKIQDTSPSGDELSKKRKKQISTDLKSFFFLDEFLIMLLAEVFRLISISPYTLVSITSLPDGWYEAGGGHLPTFLFLLKQGKHLRHIICNNRSTLKGTRCFIRKLDLCMKQFQVT